MFNRRLIKEFKEAKQYVLAIAATQWLMLLVNIWLMLVTAHFIQLMYDNKISSKAIGVLLTTLVMAIFLRSMLSSIKSKLSFTISSR